MTLLDYCKTHRGEVEVWDKHVDIANPFYVEDGRYCYHLYQDERFLLTLERWLLSLPCEEIREKVVSVDVYSFIEEHWKTIVEKMRADEDYQGFLLNWSDDIDDGEAIAEYVEDIFTTLSQGYENVAQDCCSHFLSDEPSIEKQIIEEINNRLDYNDIEVVALDHDNIDFMHIDYINIGNVDLSQGTGNVIKRFIYIPALDIVGVFVDM